eukprot:CAMPEP_0172316566 /NCGR_PEP_ID=MMETSP1058-20130122/28686_1 /TAXON_ID=83371 /ORGANISM="Detonula confervacea, Strain CCMP 353" /LENGTH=599 /DNA_ID=CAMNT_0013030905 /DNA_START=65 /DNA_END=1864 /DNA_ORIENTATION=+
MTMPGPSPLGAILLLLALSAGKNVDAFMNPSTAQYSTKLHSSASSSVRRPTPSRISETENFREAKELSQKFVADGELLQKNNGSEKKRVAIFGGGLSGLACAKYLSDAGHEPTLYEARSILGGKVSAWQDEDGDYVETGLHIFFGAYPNIHNLFNELKIEDRLQWAPHRMTFAMQELPGEFTTFEFPAGVPAPFNMAAAILLNTQMLSTYEKIAMVPALLPMLIEGQSFIDAQDEKSVQEFMREYSMPERINEEIFIAMGKALDFIDVDKLSMTVVLTAMNRFINEADGSQTAFLDGNPPERFCQPIKEWVESKGGEVICSSPVVEIQLNEQDSTVKGLKLSNGEMVQADYYVSAVPVDVFKRLIPTQWSTLPYFGQLEELKGIPVMNIQIWFDRKLNSVDGLCFSRSPLLSVYADMSNNCQEYADEKRSMLALVFAPCSPEAGSPTNWIAKSDEEIIDATMGELERLFPTEIGPNAPIERRAQLVKSTVVRVPRSVYAATPGRNKYRPSQESPIGNFVMAGDYAAQKYLGSMEGAVLSGKLAAEVICDKAMGRSNKNGLKEVHTSIQGAELKERAPVGIIGTSPVSFGGGQQGSFDNP